MNELIKKDEEIIASLYGAMLDPAGWQPGMSALSRRLGANTWNLAAWEPAASQARFSIGDPEFAKEVRGYQEYYGAIDPRRQLLVPNREPGHWVMCNREFDARFVDRNEFYQDFLIPAGMRYMLGCNLLREQDIEVQVGFLRPEDRGGYTDDELHVAQYFFPHLQLAMRIYMRTELLRVQAAVGQAGLDIIDLAVIATTETGRIIYANRKAEAFLSRSKFIETKNQHISIASSDNRKFQSALTNVSTSGRASSLRVGGDGSGCLVDILPLPKRQAFFDSVFRPWVLVLLHPVQHKRALTVRQLMQLFSLSPAEACLARALAAGATPESYASMNGLSVNTIKTQLRYIREKTGFKRMSEFVRVLTGVPSVRDEQTISDE